MSRKFSKGGGGGIVNWNTPDACLAFDELCGDAVHDK